MLCRPLLPWLFLLGTALAQSPPCTTAAVTPPPAGYHCGDQGTVKTVDAFKTTTAADSTACRNLCYANKAKCLSFSFNPGTSQCVLATGNVVNQGFKKSTTSNTFYWNRVHCFKVTCPTCPSGQNYCSALGQCTNLQTDSSNCGKCGTTCPNGQACKGGSCSCSDPGLSLCSGTCSDTSSDPANCGTCGNACPSGSICSGGSCACPVSGQTLCSGTCSDTSSDSNNCGKCGTVCPSGQLCSSGSCACAAQGQTLCSGSCSDTSSDSNNCGACGNACPSDQICSSGSCACAARGQTLCNGSCSDTSSDANNCGACGNACPTGSICAGGACSCPVPSQTLCGSTCSDTSSDASNCGGCGNACPSAQVCSGGSCACPTAGESLCGNSCTDTTSDASNCGTCGNSCPAGSICAGGACACPVPGQTLCSGNCYDTSSDQNNCGTCGNACPSVATCSGGSCVCPTAGNTLCGNSCLDTSSDQNNCGGCGNTCYSSQTCVKGSCKSCYGQSGKFQLQASNVACGNFNGGYPFYIGNDGKGDFFEMDSGQGASVSPVFYLQYGGKPAADGTCSGTLMEVVTGSEVQVGFTDPKDIGDYYVTFNKALNEPANAISLSCYIDATTNKLLCTENGQSGYWFACCSIWRWAPSVASGCGSYDLNVIAHS